MVTCEEWEVKYEIDVNNPLKSIKEIYDDIKRKLVIKSIIELNIKEFIKLLKRKYYPRGIDLKSSNGEIRAVFSKEPESLDKLLEYFRVSYKVIKYNIKESEIYEIAKKYGIDPKATFIDTWFYVRQNYEGYKLSVWYNIEENMLRIDVRPYYFIYMERHLYDSLRDALKRFRVSETEVEEIITNIKNEKDVDIYLYEDIPVEEYVDIYTNIYLENVKKEFAVISSNEWGISKDHGGKIQLNYNPSGYHMIKIEMYPPTEEKIKQLLADMKNVGMDTRIKKAADP